MHKETYLGWLNDAYSMENGLIPVLENHANDAKDHPEVQERLELHLEETRKHAEMIKECIERNGGDVSGVKEFTGGVIGKVQGAMSGMYADELVKNVLNDYAAEHFEIASYTSLTAAAEAMDDQETKNKIEEILADEEDMAAWLEEQIPKVTKQMLQKSADRAHA